MKRQIRLRVNGTDRTLEVEARTTLLDEFPRPTEEQIKTYMAGNFCRCGCYQEIQQAVKRAAGS